MPLLVAFLQSHRTGFTKRAFRRIVQKEETIQENIDALRGNYTLIIIAHRLSTIRNVDKVVLMDKGEIIDSAPFEELVKKQERFRKMVELQEI